MTSTQGGPSNAEQKVISDASSIADADQMTVYRIVQQSTDPEVLAAASKCPYIQQVVAEVGDAQMVSNSLGPFLTLASAARAAAAGGGIGEAAPPSGTAAPPSGIATSDSRPTGAGHTEFGTKDAPPTDEQAEAATEAATAL